jgi:hypothetical protein
MQNCLRLLLAAPKLSRPGAPQLALLAAAEFTELGDLPDPARMGALH